MSDLLDEVKQDLSEEKLLSALKRLLPIVIVFFVTFIVAYGVKSWWTSYQNDKIYSDGSSYLSAIIKMRSGNATEALENFEKISTNDSNYAALSSLNLAAHSAFKKDYVKAITIYRNVTENNSYAKVFRDFAQVQLVINQLESEKITSSEANEMLKSISREKSDFGALADEFRLNLLLSMNQSEEFTKLYNELLTDTTVPVSVKKRIQELNPLREVKN